MRLINADALIDWIRDGMSNVLYGGKRPSLSEIIVHVSEEMEALEIPMVETYRGKHEAIL